MVKRASRSSAAAGAVASHVKRFPSHHLRLDFATVEAVPEKRVEKCLEASPSPRYHAEKDQGRAS